MAAPERLQTRCPKCREKISVSVPLVQRWGVSSAPGEEDWADTGEDYIDYQVNKEVIRQRPAGIPTIIVLVGFAILGIMLFLTLRDRGKPPTAPSRPKKEAPGGQATPPAADGTGSVAGQSASTSAGVDGSVGGETTPTDPAASLSLAVKTGLQFLNAKTWEEAATMVRHPEIVRPRMEKYYRAHPYSPLTAIVLRPHIRKAGSLLMTWVEAQGVTGRVFVLEQTADGFKIDWESFVIYSQIDWPELMETRPAESPVEVRVRASPTQWKSDAFPADEGFIAFRITQPHTGHVLFAHFNPATSKRSEALSRLLAERAGLFTLTIRYPDNAKSGVDVLIDEVICAGWVRK